MEVNSTRSTLAGLNVLSNEIAQFKVRIFGRVKQGPYSKLVRYGLCRDLEAASETPQARIPIKVRKALPSDIEAVLPLDRALPHSEQLNIAWRRRFFLTAPDMGHVAIDQRNEKPCYIQWLIPHSSNAIVRKLAGFPDLAPGEALLENAYTPVEYRGLGIMPAAMGLISEHASAIGARRLMTYVASDNIASLKGCQRASFNPHLLHTCTRIAFGLIVRHSFEILAKNDPRRSVRF